MTEIGEVYVVAPESEQSGASHSLTLSRPLRIRQIDERHWTVDGTPTDCVTLALNRILLQDERPAHLRLGYQSRCESRRRRDIFGNRRRCDGSDDTRRARPCIQPRGDPQPGFY